jgi:hypothetical protein
MKFFQTDVNVFTYHDKQNCYSKRYSYIYSTKAIFSLNVGLLDLPKYQHAVWLENFDSACNCFACSKCQMRVKQSTVSLTEYIIDPYFTGDPNA